MPNTEVTIRLNSQWVILRGIFSLLFGLITLSWPGATLIAITLLFGMYALTDGLFAIGTGIQLERRNEPYGMAIFEGVIGVSVGVLTLLWPKITLIALSILTGIWALSTGCLEVLAAFEFSQITLTRGSKTARWILGLMGVFSIGLGLAIFVWPVLGTITLISLIATYALGFGALTIAFGFYLRKTERLAKTEKLKTPPSEQNKPRRAA